MLLIIVDYSYIFFICVQVNICDLLHKRKACCKKGMSHSEGFFNLTVVVNMFPVKNFLYKKKYIYINIYRVSHFKQLT